MKDCTVLILIVIVIFNTERTGATKLCDVRIWYLNLITDNVFGIDMNAEQLSIKNSIETLVLTAAASHEQRMTDCNVLVIYSHLLKEKFNYTPSGMGIALNEIDSEGVGNVDPADVAYIKNTAENNHVDKNFFKSPQEIENRVSNINNNGAVMFLEKITDKKMCTLNEANNIDNVKLVYAITDQSDLHPEEREPNDDHLKIDIGNIKTLPNTIEKNTDQPIEIDAKAYSLDIDETEISEENKDNFEPDLHKYSGDIQEKQDKGKHENPNDTIADSYLPMLKPPGVCYSFGCVITNSCKPTDKCFSSERGIFGKLKNQPILQQLTSPEQAYKIFESPPSTKEYEDSNESQQHTESKSNTIQNTPQNKQDVVRFMTKEEDALDNNGQDFTKTIEIVRKYVADEINAYSRRKKIEKYNKLHAVENRIIRLENNLLYGKSEKDTQTITNLERKLASLEKDFVNIRDMSASKQTQLELDYIGKSNRNEIQLLENCYVIATKQNTELSELAEFQKSQSRAISQLKEMYINSEDESRRLNEVVIDQTLLLQSLSRTLNDLMAENSRNKAHISVLQEKVENIKCSADVHKQTVRQIERHTNAINRNGQVHQNTDASFENTKENDVAFFSSTDKQHADNDQQKPSSYSKRYFKRNDTCPKCYYNACLVSCCSPYSAISWSHCSEIVCVKNEKNVMVADQGQPQAPVPNDTMDEEQIPKGTLEELNSKESNTDESERLPNGNVIPDDQNVKRGFDEIVDDNKSVHNEQKEYTLIGYDKEGKPVVRHKSIQSDEEEKPQNPVSSTEKTNQNALNDSASDDTKLLSNDSKTNANNKKLHDAVVSPSQIHRSATDQADKENKEIPGDIQMQSQQKEIQIESALQESSKTENVDSTRDKENKEISDNIQMQSQQKEIQIESALPESSKTVNVDRTRNKETVGAHASKISAKEQNDQPDKGKPANLNLPDHGQPKDCYDHYVLGNRKDGLFKVRPLGSENTIEVFCDMRNGGWTVIQRRQDGTTNFFQTWEDYKKGFGGLYGEHWLGNDNIYLLTNQNYYKLRVDLMDWDKTKKIAYYQSFLVDHEREGYMLHIGGYSGDAGDGLGKHDESMFSTKDVDNDKVSKEFGGSCAKRFYGAGWYYKCYSSNLNGKFYKGGTIPEKRYDGITWKPWTGPNNSLKKVEMKIKPASAKD